jgi:hypothetical protein
VTPAFVYAALLGVAGLMIVPPVVGTFASARPLIRPWLVTACLMLATAIATAAAWRAPAYTYEQPLRRYVRALQDGEGAQAIWEIASVEPGIDLAEHAPGGWTIATEPAQGISVPWGRYRLPFVFRTTGPSLGPAPISISGFTVKPLAEGVELTLAVTPSEPGLTVSFVLPAGLTPARSSLPGGQQLGRWTATFAAVPREGLAWEASFRGDVGEQLRQTRVAVTSSRFPGGQGWQQLPAWLPQDRAVWTASASWSVAAASGPAIAPVPPLR